MATMRTALAPEPAPASTRPSANGIMQLPDEAVEYAWLDSLAPVPDAWTPLAELQAKHLLPRQRLVALAPTLNAVRGQVAAEREITEPKPEQSPLHAGFIDLPQKMLENYRRKGEASEVGRIQAIAGRLREEVDRVVILGAGGCHTGPRALLEALLPAHHNELPASGRLGRPRFSFEGDGADSDSLQDLLDMLENTCIDPELRAERWGVIVSDHGNSLDTAAAFRLFRGEAARFYGSTSAKLKQLIVPVTAASGPLRDLCLADGYATDDILTLPANVGGRFSAFTAAGLLPAAVMGLDVRALLLGASAMTRRFLEEPFERNPVLQFAAVNHILAQEMDKPVRVLAVWSRKLEALGHWYNQLLAESLGKQGRGPTPLTAVMPRDMNTRGQQLLEGARDKMINNLVVRSSRHQPTALGMADRNEDGLNAIARKTFSDIQNAAWQASVQASRDAARPTADLILPLLTEHTLGQLMQMLMLATVVEARLLGVNPYSEPGLRGYRGNVRTILGMT